MRSPLSLLFLPMLHSLKRAVLYSCGENGEVELSVTTTTSAVVCSFSCASVFFSSSVCSGEKSKAKSFTFVSYGCGKSWKEPCAETLCSERDRNDRKDRINNRNRSNITIEEYLCFILLHLTMSPGIFLNVALCLFLLLTASF